MPPTLYLLRHGEAEHNIKHRHYLRDPPLTPLGRKQCAALSAAVPDGITTVMASPLQRAIQTAAALARPDVPLVLVPLAQEIGANACDKGRSADELRAALPGMLGASTDDAAVGYRSVDLRLVEEGWNSKTGIYAATVPAVIRRAARLRAWLRARPADEVIALVSHGAFMHYLVDDWAGYDAAKGTAFLNCEVHRYGFAVGHDDDDGDGSPLVALDGPASEPGYCKIARPAWVNRKVLGDGRPAEEWAAEGTRR